jgi:hypothetical protein
MCNFLWTSIDTVQRGKCAAAWSTVQRPLPLGGLGIPDLKLMGMALRLRWLSPLERAVQPVADLELRNH